MNGKMFYVRVPRAQPKKPLSAPLVPLHQQAQPQLHPQQQFQQQRIPNQPGTTKLSNIAKVPLRASNDGSPKADADQVYHGLMARIVWYANTALRVQSGRVEEVGIGIGLALDEERSLIISNLIPGSPALRSGLLEIGDALRNVDGRDVRGMSPEQARPPKLLLHSFLLLLLKV